MRVPFQNLRVQHAVLRDDLLAAIGQVIDESAFAGGPHVARFEQEFAAYCQVPHAVGVSSGTAALWLALKSLGVGPGDEVVTVPASFFATAEAISQCGATPVFVDVDEQTGTMAPERIEPALTPRTKAIVPVHLYGNPADMDPILAIARRHGLVVVEDACQAHGARYQGRRVGSLGDAGCFSFYPAKNLGALGDAGAVTTGSRAVAERIMALRDHGQSAKYHHAVVGWNARMDGIQAAALSIKLRQLDDTNSRRETLARRYDAHFAKCAEIGRAALLPGTVSSRHLYPVRVAHRDQVLSHLTERGIGCGVHYPVPIHLQPAYAGLGYRPGSFPAAEGWANEVLSLPLYPELTADEVDLVAAEVLSLTADSCQTAGAHA